MRALRYVVASAPFVAGVYMFVRHVAPALMHVLLSPVGGVSADDWLGVYGLVFVNLALALILVVLLWDELYGPYIARFLGSLGVEVDYDDDCPSDDSD